MNNKEIKQEALKIFKEKQWLDVGANATYSVIANAAPIIVGGPITAGFSKYLINRVRRNEEGKFTDVFSGFKEFGKNFVTFLLEFVYLLLWGMLFYIPLFIKAFAYRMTFFIMQDFPLLRGNAAITASRILMRGHKWELFCLYLRFLGWILLGCLTFGILNILYVTPWMNTATALFYENIKNEKKEEIEKLFN